MALENFIIEYKTRKHTDLLHVLDVVREGKFTDDTIIEDLINLLRRGKIVFAYEGTHVFCNPAEWTDEEWKKAQTEKGTFLYSALKALYRMGFKKRELERLRYIMRNISRKTNGYIRPSWGFIRAC